MSLDRPQPVLTETVQSYHASSVADRPLSGGGNATCASLVLFASCIPAFPANASPGWAEGGGSIPQRGYCPCAAAHCGADERQALEQLRRYIARPVLANKHVQFNAVGQVVLKPKAPAAIAPGT